MEESILICSNHASAQGGIGIVYWVHKKVFRYYISRYVRQSNAFLLIPVIILNYFNDNEN